MFNVGFIAFKYELLDYHLKHIKEYSCFSVMFRLDKDDFFVVDGESI